MKLDHSDYPYQLLTNCWRKIHMLKGNCNWFGVLTQIADSALGCRVFYIHLTKEGLTVMPGRKEPLICQREDHIVVRFKLFLRTLHEEENGPSGSMSNKMFAVIFIGINFLYQLDQGWVFPAITSISLVCWACKTSVTT